MLSLEVAPSPPSDWDSSLASNGGGMFHLSAWAEFRRARGDGDPVYLTWMDGGQPVAFAMGIETRPQAGPFRFRNLTIDSPPLPTSDDPELPDLIGSALRDWTRETGGTALLVLNCHHPQSAWGATAFDSCHETFDFPLQPATEEEIISRMSRSNRSLIRKSVREGLTMREGSSLEDCATVDALRNETLEHLGRSKNVISTPTASDRYTAALGGAVESGFMRLFIAEFNGEPVAALGASIDSTSARFIVHGANGVSRRINGIRALFAKAIGDLSASGAGSVNLGSIGAHSASPSSIDHGLYEFKLVFGAKPELCRGGRMIAHPVKGRAILAARRLKANHRRAR